MAEILKLLVFETRSIPRGYKALHQLSELSLVCLEFSPHADGVRILFRVDQSESDLEQRLLPLLNQEDSCEIVEVNHAIMKATLSQTGTGLQKSLLVFEVDQYVQLLRLSMQLTQLGAVPLEIRSLRSNAKRNYGIFTMEKTDGAKNLLVNFDFAIIPSDSKALQEFLGFSS